MIYKEGCKGPYVKEIQSLLKSLGYRNLEVDGIYGSATFMAMKYFQIKNGILPTGVVEHKTKELLEKLFLGYETYLVKAGDSFESIARDFDISLNSLLRANEAMSYEGLVKNKELVIPIRDEIVMTNIDYTYDVFIKNMKGLKIRYPFLQMEKVGKSVLQRELYCIKLGVGEKKVFYNASHHSLEWITSVVLMKFVEDYCKAYVGNTKLKEYNINEIWNNCTIYIMPMVNPDGVDLVLNGLKKDNPYYDNLLLWNKDSKEFSKTWQANIRGVDTNHNYNAGWEKAKKLEQEAGITGPGPTRYGGIAPESEPETRAVVRLCNNNEFKLALCYHSQGEVIYWNYMNKTPKESKPIGEVFSRLSGYELSNPVTLASYAGCKDWFIEKFRRPAYTIEVGIGKNPLPISQFDKIYKENIRILLEAAII